MTVAEVSSEGKKFLVAMILDAHVHKERVTDLLEIASPNTHVRSTVPVVAWLPTPLASKASFDQPSGKRCLRGFVTLQSRSHLLRVQSDRLQLQLQKRLRPRPCIEGVVSGVNVLWLACALKRNAGTKADAGTNFSAPCGPTTGRECMIYWLVCKHQ